MYLIGCGFLMCRKLKVISIFIIVEIGIQKITKKLPINRVMVPK
mgnify:CR=1 FL=1